MKKILLTCFSLLLCLICYSKQRQYIYVFDCTQSMDNEFQIWEPAKTWLHNDIGRKRENALISIVPFRDKSDGLITPFLKQDLNWSSIEGRFNQLISSPHSKTGICKAWDEGIKLINPNYENWFILLTDGKDGYDGSTALKERMLSWCQYHEGCHAYVIALSKLAYDALYTDLSKCDDIEIIKAYENKFIPIIGSFIKKPLSMLASAPKNFKIGFSEEGKYKAHVKCDDEYYKISLENNEINNECAHIIVTEIKRPTKDHEVHFSMISDQSEVKFSKPTFSIYVDTRELANVNFDRENGDEYDADEISTYDSFLFFPRKEWSETNIDLSVVFNNQAREKGAKMKFKIDVPKDLQGMCSFSLNGKSISNYFVLNSNCNQSILTIRINHNAPEMDYDLQIVGIGEGIESVNGEYGNKYVAHISVEHSIGWNPLLIIIVCLGIIILVCCILRVIYSHIRRGVYCGIDYINEKGSQEVLVRKRKANRIILSCHPKKQLWIDWLFNGKTLYNCEQIDGLSSNIQLNAARQKRRMRVRLRPNNKLKYDGITIRNQFVTADEDVRHEISDNDNKIILTFILF